MEWVQVCDPLGSAVFSSSMAAFIGMLPAVQTIWLPWMISVAQ